MQDGPITTTSAAGLQPLGTAAQRSFELLSAALEQRLDPAHAALLAEPVATAQGDRIDWYTQPGGEVLPLSDLPEAQAQSLRARLGEMVAQIRAEADRLGQSASPEDQRLGEALANCVEIPGPDMIFARRDGQGDWSPVLVHWAWLAEDGRAVRGVLSAMVPRAAPVVPVTPIDAPQWRGWWWLVLLGWIALALMVGAILALLIAPCALMPGRLGQCPPAPVAVAAAMSEARTASDEVAAIERALGLARRQCQPTIPLSPLTVPPETRDAPESAPPPSPTQSPRPPQSPTPPQSPAPPGQPDLREGRADPPGDAERAAAASRLAERGGARGDLNFTLEWHGMDDVDLYVTCPTGQTVSHRNRGDCGGTLDLDANVSRKTARQDPVENVVFEDAPLGIYKVRAHLRAHRSDIPVAVTLHVLRRDGPSQSYVGMVRPKERSWTTVISISR